DSKGALLVRAEPRRWALLVGVKKYEHLRDLNFCARDMDQLRDVLVKSGGYSEECVRLIADVKGAEKTVSPTRENIEKAWESLLSEVGEEDTVLFAFSGHGMQQEGKGFLMTSDADPKNLEKTALAMSRIYELLDNCPAKSKVVLIDACHSGATKGTTVSLKNFVGGENVYGLFSCTANQESYEDEKLRHGVFTYYLIKALRGEADLNPIGNGDKKVSFTEVFNYLRMKVPPHVKSTHKADQTPFFKAAGSVIPDLSQYKFAPVPEDSALLTIPGLNGGWWFSETPWLLPFVREKLSKHLRRHETSGVAAERWSKPDVAAVHEALRLAFRKMMQDEKASVKSLLIQLRNWKGETLSTEDQSSIFAGLKKVNDLHSLAVFQHFFGLPQAGQSYETALKQLEKDSRRAPGRYALCLNDYGRWLASEGKPRQACAQFELARDAIADVSAAPLFHITAWCLDADSRRKLGEWSRAEKSLQTAQEMVKKHLEESHPLAAHIHRRFAWMYMDQWRLSEAKRNFEAANRVGLLPAKGKIEDLPFQARVFVYHNFHGLAMCSRYSGKLSAAINTYEKLEQDISHEIEASTVPSERQALQSRRENTMQRLADCYLFSSPSQARTATDIYKQSYRLSGEFPRSQQQAVRPKLLCKSAIALVLRGGMTAEATADLERLKTMKLAESRLKAVSMYRQIAEAFLQLKTENTAADRQRLRDAIGRIVGDVERKRFSRDEFDLLFLASSELIRRESNAEKPNPSKLVIDVERLFGIIPSRFLRADVLPYLRPYFDLALSRWIKHLDANRIIDLMAYVAIAKTGSQFAVLGSRDVVVFYYPLAPEEKGVAIVYSPKTKHRIIPLNETAAQIAQRAKSGSKKPSSANIPAELAKLLQEETTRVHWNDVVHGFDPATFPYPKSDKLQFLGNRRR
ncbi:MAG: caspase family protein, partial [Planctomycetes bacterium]|nr:caspase family protein [Planctomycetota bacterium]